MDPSGVLVNGSVDFYLEVSLKKLEDIFNWKSNFATYIQGLYEVFRTYKTPILIESLAKICNYFEIGKQNKIKESIVFLLIKHIF